MPQFTPPPPSAFEFALSKFAPGLALDRYRKRVAFSYEGARIGRLRDVPQHNPNPETARESYDRIKLMEQVRDLCENLPLFPSVLTKLGNYALGQLRYQARTGDREVNRQIERYLAEWFRDCDVSGRFSFADMARVALYSTLRDGDFFWVWRQVDGSLKLQGVEADRVGGNLPRVSENEASGIIFDPSTGRPIEYRTYRRNQAGGYVDEKIIPAADVIAFYDHLRYDQYRGITRFASAVNAARDFKEMMEAVRIGVKFENYHGGVHYSERGQPDDPTDYFAAGADRTANGQPIGDFNLQPGTVKHLPNTSRIDFVKSDRPSGQFQAYAETLIREILCPLNLPMGFAWDLSSLGGPAARMDAAQAYRSIRYLQTEVMAPRMKRAVDRVIMQGIAEGRIDYTDDWQAGHFQFPAMPTIDVGRDTNAGIAEVRAGLRSKADYFAEEGKDVDEEDAVIAGEAAALIQRAKEISDRTKFPIERVVDMLDMRIPNGTPPIVMPSEGEEDDAPLITSIGDAGARALTEILARVGAGEISPEAGRQILQTVFGLSPEAAARMVPDTQPTPAQAPQEAAPQVTEAEFQSDSYKPTAEMATNAKRALEVRRSKPASQRGMTEVGIARARDIMNRRPLSLETVKRMKAYFDRHAVDKDGATWGEQGKGWQAWNGWGGDAGRTWANAIVERAEKEEMQTVATPVLSPAGRKLLQIADGIRDDYPVAGADELDALSYACERRREPAEDLHAWIESQRLHRSN
jgi:capsid protein